MKPTARLENWYVGEYDLIYGNVYDSPHIPDGYLVSMSRVGKLEKGNIVIETSKVLYVLGEPLHKDEKTKPMQRMIDETSI